MLNEQSIRKIVDDEIQKKLYQLPKVPPHKHDGVSNIKTDQRDINYNNKFAAFVFADGTGGGGTIVLKGGSSVQIVGNTAYYPLSVQNPTRVAFYGIAYDSRNSPPDYKQSINGVAELGNCYDFNNTFTLSKVSNGVIQANNGVYITPGAPFVVADQIHLATVQDITNINEGINIVELDVVSFSANSITITAKIAFDYWVLRGSLIIT